jgi:uncharacterized damage-inducible protein DinB
VHDSLSPLYEIFKLNSRLLLNCLDGMKEDQARWRPGPACNSAAFIAAHLVGSRQYLGTVMGLDLPSPFGGRLDATKSIGETKDLPQLEEIRAEWKTVTGNLRERFKEITADDLAKPYAGQFPVADRTTLGVIAFLIQHDSYHIGQLGLLRKQAGLESMRYT